MLKTVFLSILTLTLVSVTSVFAAQPVRIGVSLGLTGKYDLTSEKQKNAYLLFEEVVNKKGGILGRPVEFLIRDNSSRVERAVAQYELLLIKDKVDFIIGPYTSKLTLAVSAVAERYQSPMLAAGAAADIIWKKGYKNVFGMWTPASRYVLGFLKLLLYNHFDDIAIVTGTGEFAEGLSEGALKWARALRLNVLDSFSVGDEGNYDEIAEQLKELKPRIVICTGHYEVGTSLKKSMEKFAFHPEVYYATVGPTFQQYYDTFGAVAEGDFSTAIWEPHPRLQFPGSQDFARMYEAKFGLPPTYHAASAFAAAEVLKKAVEQVGSLDKAKVRNALQTMNTMSVIGRYAVDRTGIQIKRFPLIVQWQKGKKEIVWPLELQTAPAEFQEK